MAGRQHERNSQCDAPGINRLFRDTGGLCFSGDIFVPDLGNVLSGITRMAVIDVAHDIGLNVEIKKIKYNLYEELSNRIGNVSFWVDLGDNLSGITAEIRL